jgi:phage anti-repressor protein
MTEALAQIVPIQQNANGIPTVNARDVHKALESKKDFSDWIKARINKYGFVEGKDYTVVETLSSPSQGNAKSRPQTLKEYHVSLSMAKELAMVENTEKGKAARLYFIEAEERFRNLPAPTGANAIILIGQEMAKLEMEVQTIKATQRQLAEDVDFTNSHLSLYFPPKGTLTVAAYVMSRQLTRQVVNNLTLGGVATKLMKTLGKQVVKMKGTKVNYYPVEVLDRALEIYVQQHREDDIDPAQLKLAFVGKGA